MRRFGMVCPLTGSYPASTAGLVLGSLKVGLWEVSGPLNLELVLGGHYRADKSLANWCSNRMLFPDVVGSWRLVDKQFVYRGQSSSYCTARDRITRVGARAPGAEYNPTPRRHTKESSARHSAGQPIQTTQCVKDGGKPGVHRRMPGAGLSRRCSGKAPSDMPAFQPYWGKPAVRNDRGRWKRRHHSKPATRHCPTRLRGAISDDRPYRDSYPRGRHLEFFADLVLGV